MRFQLVDIEPGATRRPLMPSREQCEEAQEQANRCAAWLRAQGFEVLRAEATRRNPRITIRTSPLCDRLEGAVRGFQRVGRVETRYWVAVRFGCEVRWIGLAETQGGAK